MVLYESLEDGIVWSLTNNKYLLQNQKLISCLPFDLKYDCKKMVYENGLVVLLEEFSHCHLFEVNEYYNVINHTQFDVSKEAKRK